MTESVIKLPAGAQMPAPKGREASIYQRKEVTIYINREFKGFWTVMELIRFGMLPKGETVSLGVQIFDQQIRNLITCASNARDVDEKKDLLTEAAYVMRLWAKVSQLGFEVIIDETMTDISAAP